MNADEDTWRRLAAQLREAAAVADQVAAERERVFAMTACRSEEQELLADARSAGRRPDHD